MNCGCRLRHKYDLSSKVGRKLGILIHQNTALRHGDSVPKSCVLRMRRQKFSLIWRCYGGHNFSPTQALSFDSMLRSLPDDSEYRELCLAAVIIAASNCVAAPGHTAQPFKATQTAAAYLRYSWERDPFRYARTALKKLCPLHATKPGNAIVADANQVAKELDSKDVVFVDPPYSAVQYSRFYHVLETIARGACSKVEGVGRYPPPEERPNSCYSKKSISAQTIEDLLRTLF